MLVLYLKGEIFMKKTKMELELELEEKEKEIKDLKKEIEAAKRKSVYDDSVAEIKAMYDSFIEQGFSDEQAYGFTIKMVERTIAMANGR
jgi:sugar-specific transcriptional regulator TrmB